MICFLSTLSDYLFNVGRIRTEPHSEWYVTDFLQLYLIVGPVPSKIENGRISVYATPLDSDEARKSHWAWAKARQISLPLDAVITTNPKWFA